MSGVRGRCGSAAKSRRRVLTAKSMFVYLRSSLSENTPVPSSITKGKSSTSSQLSDPCCMRHSGILVWGDSPGA
eukprot:1084874-Rhodomonas_salina.1